MYDFKGWLIRPDLYALEEACARLRRGETLEAITLLERAIPALDGLRAAVLHLAGRPFND